VKLFLLFAVLTALFVLGPMLAMRPSARQGQLARLRAHAQRVGLRVRFRPGNQGGVSSMVYVLPWRMDELARARAISLRYLRTKDAAWESMLASPPGSPSLDAALACLPPGVSEFSTVEEGIAVVWPERGTTDDVDALLEALEALRLACLGGGGQLRLQPPPQ
jgi:hypothetical protein